MDPIIQALAQQLIAQDPSVSWQIGGIDRAVELATMLAAQGVTDLSGMGISGSWTADPNAGRIVGGAEGGEFVPAGAGTGGYNLTFGDISLGNLGSSSGVNDRILYDTGEILDSEYGGGPVMGYRDFVPGEGTLWQGGKGWDPTNGQYGEIAWSPEGDGNVGYKVVTGPDGQIQLMPEWGSSSDMDMIGPALAIAAVAFGAPYLLEVIGGMVGAGGAAGAGAGLTASELAMADIALGGMGGSAGASALGTAMAGGIYSPLAAELGWDIASNGMDLFDLGGNMTGEAQAAVQGWTDAQLGEFGLTRAADGTIAMDSAFSGMPGVTGTPITAGGPVVTPTVGAPITPSTPSYTAPTSPTSPTGTPRVPSVPGGGSGGGGSGGGGGGGLWDWLVGGAQLWGAYDIYDTVRDMGPKLRDAYMEYGGEMADKFSGLGTDVMGRYNTLGQWGQDQYNTLGTNTAANYANLGTNIQGQYNNLSTDVLGRYNTLGQTTANQYNTLGQTTRDAYNTFGQNYQNQFSNLASNYQNQFTNLGNQYQNAYTNFGEGINTRMTGLGADVGGRMTALGSTFGDRMAGLGSTYEGKFGALADQAKGAIGTFSPVDINGPLASTSGGKITLSAPVQGMFDSATTSATRSFDAANQLDLNNLRQQEFDLMQAVMADQRAQEFSDLESRRQAQGMMGLQSFNQANSFQYQDPNTGQTYTAGADPMMVALMKGRQQADLQAYLQADENALNRYTGLIGAGTQASSVPLSINAQALQQQQQGYNQGEQAFRSNLAGVQTWLNPAMQGLSTGFQGGMQGLQTAYQGGMQGLGTEFQGGMQGLQSAYGAGMQGLGSGFNAGMQGLQSGLQTNVQGLNAGYNAGMQGIGSQYNAGMQGIGSQFNAGMQGIGSYNQNQAQGIGANLTTNMQGLGSQFQAGLQGIGTNVQNQAQGINNYSNLSGQGLTTEANLGTAGLNAWAGSEWQAANVYANLLQSILGTLGGTTSQAGGSGGPFGGIINEIGGDVWDWFKGLF